MRLPVIVAVLLAAGCSAGGAARQAAGPSPSASAASRSASAVPASGAPVGITASYAPAPLGAATWRRADLRAASPVVSAGGVAVLLTLDTGSLRLVGLDPAAGGTRWRHDAALPTDPAGEPRVAVFGSTVVTSDAGGVLAVDAATGRVRWHVDLVAVGWPTHCRRTADQVCVIAQTPKGGTLRRLQAATGAEVATGIAPRVVRELAPGLYDSGQRDPDLVVGVGTDGRSLWTASLVDLFGETSASAATTWAIQRRDDAGLYVGSVGRAQHGDPGASARLDLAATTTAGVVIADGSSGWVDRGSDALCAPVLTSRPADDDTAPAVRCRGTGTLSSRGASPLVADGPLAVSVEGYASRTGQTRWSVPLPDAGHLYADPRHPPRLAAGVIVLPGTTDRTLDLRTGAVGALTAGAGLWCTLDQEAELGDAFAELAPAVQPCAVDGSPVPVPAEVPPWIGTAVGSVRVWAGPEGVTALG